MRWQDMFSCSGLEGEENKLPYEVIKLTPQQAAGMLLTYYTKPKSSDSP